MARTDEIIGVSKTLHQEDDLDLYIIRIKTRDRNLDSIIDKVRSLIDEQDWEHWENGENRD